MLVRRHEIHNVLEMNVESIGDALIAGMLDDKKYADLGKNALDNNVNKEVESIMETRNVFPSKINTEKCFNTCPKVEELFYEWIAKDENYHLIVEAEYLQSKNINKESDDDIGDKQGNDDEKIKSLKEDESSNRIEDDTRSEMVDRENNDMHRRKEYKFYYSTLKLINELECNDIIVLFIKACIEHLKGKNMKAHSIIKNDVFYYSKILNEYLAIPLGAKEISTEFKRVMKSNSDDKSVLFYSTLIYLQLHDMKYVETLAQGVMKYLTLFYTLKICYLIQNKEYEKVRDIIEQVKDVTIPLLSLFCEFYFFNKEYENVPFILEKMEKINEEDPRILLFNAMLKEAINEEGVKEEILSCIKKDETFIKPLLVLVNYLMNKNEKECIKFFEMAKESSCLKEDVALAVNSLFIMKVQDYCVKEYPKLFN